MIDRKTIQNHAFSLVELSIVLVILGLLTGGILAGQSLIRAAEIRAVATESQRYVAAVHSFRDKYLGVPGDFRDATRFWNRQTATADCVSNTGLSSAGSPGTCDGNGNGIITAAAAASQSGEEFQAWRQLALAGLVEGSYTGLAGSGAYDDFTTGVNAPASRLGTGMWRIRTMGDASGTVTGTLTSTFALNYGSTLEHGTSSGAGLLKPEETWNIDTKIDDGQPARGQFIARGWDSCTNATSRTDLAASYKLTDSTIACRIILRNLF